MRNAWRLVWLLLREAVRNKVLWIFALAATLMVMASLVLGEMVVGRPGKATWDLGLSAMNLLSLMVLVFLGVPMASTEIEGRMLHHLLSKPLSRRHFLLAVYVSLMILMTLSAVMMGLLSWAMLGLQPGALAGLVVAILWNLLEMSVMGAVVLFCAMISSPQLAMFISLCFYAIGHSLSQALLLVSQGGSVVARSFVWLLNIVLPNLSFFNHKTAIAAGVALPLGWTLVWAVLYALTAASIWLWLADRLFARKEL